MAVGSPGACRARWLLPVLRDRVTRGVKPQGRRT
jgi:hypothetical protein